MNASRKNLVASRTLLAFAVASAWQVAHAQDIGELTAGGSSVAVGAGISTGDENDRTRFGMFNGLRKHDANLLFGFRYEQPWSASGTGLRLEGRNLGLDNREANFVWRRPGDFKFTGEYSQITRHDPRTINTSQAGFGTATPVINPGGVLIAPGTGQSHNLELQRKGIGFGLEKWISRTLQVELSFKNEEKDGARMWGRGFNCSATWPACITPTSSTATGLLLLAEPVDSTIRQLDARLNYTNGPLVLSGAYYGSFYINHFGSLAPTVNAPLGNLNGGQLTAAQSGGLANALSLPLALWPDNQSHTLSLAGNYALTAHTRVNFKYAYTRATQDESFGGMGLPLPLSGRGSLEGEINTTKAQAGISMHPFPKLHLSADLGYRHRQNKTPLDWYNVNGTNLWTNGNQSPTTVDAKAQASYMFMPGYTGVLGAKVEDEDFGKWTPTEVPGGVSGVKQKTRQTGWRAELRRTMSEQLTGSVAYEQERRKGRSPWLKPQSPANAPYVGVGEASADCPRVNNDVRLDPCIYNRTAIFPFIYMDKERDKIRGTVNWTPMEKLSVQVFADRGIDRYHGPTEHGLRTFQMGTVSLDVSYALSDAWKISGFGSRGRQTVAAGHSTGYDALLKDTATSFGVGVKGKPLGVLQVGADFMWLDDVLKYHETADDPTNAAGQILSQTGGLPDVNYKLTRLNLYGEYALQRNAYVRLDYIFHRTFFNEWTFNYNGVPFLYSDNTTVDAKQRQTVNFIGATYVYKFQ